MQSSISGKSYEALVAGLFKIASTAGSSNRVNDIRIPWNGTHIDVEVKRTVRAEFGQKRAELKDGVLVVPNPLFQDCIAHTELFSGKVPPFLTGKMTFPEWERVASEFADEQYTASPDSIAQYYRQKGNAYIQVKGYGLYHTGEDVAGFGVPQFRCSTYLRVRCKRHGTKCPETGNHIPTSVMTSFWVRDPPEKSPYSIDSMDTMPERLRSLMTP